MKERLKKEIDDMVKVMKLTGQSFQIFEMGAKRMLSAGNFVSLESHLAEWRSVLNYPGIIAG